MPNEQQPGPPLDLEEIRVFLAIVDEGSVLGAARRLGAARSSVRRRLDELEARVGVPVLHRTAEGTVLTEAGKLLARQGRRLLDEAESLRIDLRGINEEFSGTVRVVAPHGMPPDAAVFAIAGFEERFPGIRVDLQFVDGSDAELDLEGVDVYVQFGDRMPTGPWVTFVVHRLRCWLIATQGWIDRNGPVDTLEALQKHRVRCWRTPDRPSDELPLLAGGSVKVQASLVSSDVHLLRQIVRAGHGLAMVPDGMIPEPEGNDGPVVPVLQELVGSTYALRVLVPERLLRVAKVRQTIEELRAFVQTMGLG